MSHDTHHDINHASHDLMDPDDRDNNTSGNPHMNDVLAARLHRRHVLKGGVGAMSMAGLGSLGLAACGGDDAVVAAPAPAAAAPTFEGLLKFKAVDKSIADRIVVAEIGRAHV